MATREVELQQLIKEQEHDMKYGDVIRGSERGAISLTEKLASRLSNEGFEFGTKRRKTGYSDECLLHGRQDLAPPSPSKAAEGRRYTCRVCQREAKRLWWEKNREYALAKHRRWVSQKHENDPEYRADVLRRNRETRKRKYNSDPEYRAKQRERAKQWREKHAAGA